MLETRRIVEVSKKDEMQVEVSHFQMKGFLFTSVTFRPVSDFFFLLSFLAVSWDCVQSHWQRSVLTRVHTCRQTITSGFEASWILAKSNIQSRRILPQQLLCVAGMIFVIARTSGASSSLVAPDWALFTVCGSNKSPTDVMWNTSVLSRAFADNNYPQPDWLRPPRPRVNFPFTSLQKILSNLLFGCPLEYSDVDKCWFASVSFEIAPYVEKF